MNTKSAYSQYDACIAAGFDVQNNVVYAYGQQFPLVDPLAIHLKVYRTHDSHDTRYTAMKAAFDILWPKQQLTYNYWMERMFREHCDHSTEIFTIAGGGGLGKAVVNGTPVRTPTGWTPVELLKPGDSLAATDGTVQTVIGVYPQGIRDIYRVHFSDGTSADVDGDHLWTVYSAKQRDHKSKPQTVTTTHILQTLSKNYSLPHHSPVHGEHSNSLPIHPYILGILLGNGSLSEKSISAYISSEHTVAKILSLIPTATAKYKPRSHCWRVAFPAYRKYLPVTKAFGKFIYPQYLIASVQQRIDLLHGLMDTDGYVSKDGTSQYTTVSPQLAKDVEDLARGLGFMVRTASKIPTYTYKNNRKLGQRAYTISILRTPTTSHIPLCTVPHKAIRDKQLTRQIHAQKRIIDVTPLPSANATCIKVSNPNQLFFIKDYVVTHNTQTSAYIASLFWLALPTQRAVIVTSTTVESLKSRIYGYILRALKEASLPLPLTYKNTPPPAIYPTPPDHIHGIFGIAAKQGDDANAIKDIIGRHPKNALLLILDEAPHMPIAIMESFTNLKKGLADRFQCIAIGNPDSTTDLHGILSTPIVGWDKLDPSKDFRWRTTQPNGICLYFNPYDSPAIHEPDPIKKRALSQFMFTEKQLLEAEQKEGTDSEAFWRFTMGFWKSRSTESTIVSEAFLRDYNPQLTAEFSGKYPLHTVAGLDPAFSAGGDKCILRLAILGHHVNGNVVLDFRNEQLLFNLKLSAHSGQSAELQIADQVLDILREYRVPVHHLCIDASGQGRGLADVIHLRNGALTPAPTKIYSTNLGNRHTPGNTFDIRISSAHEMWFTGREFIAHRQIYGLDKMAYGQLYSRLVIDKNGKKVLEKKTDYKKRMGAISGLFSGSPDEADGAMLCLQSAIIHHGFFTGQQMPANTPLSKTSRDYEQAVREYNARIAPANKNFVLKANYTGSLYSAVTKKVIQ